MSVTKTLIITNEDLKERYDLPKDFKVIRGGTTSGSKRGEHGGIFAEIESSEFKPEDQGKPIQMKDNG